MTNASNLSLDQLKRAVLIKEQLTNLENQLSSLLGGKAPAAAPAVKPGGMSAAAKAKLSAMAKARWAKIKAGNNKPSAAKPAAPASPAAKPAGLSEAARKKISDAAKARWAKVKAGSKTAPSAKKVVSALKAAAPKAAAPARKPITAAQKAKIAATLKARWAKIKAGKSGGKK